ncbi:MAG TPA: hypothetical protein VGJ03_04500, partial [Acidimicrobiales bacterium]
MPRATTMFGGTSTTSSPAATKLLGQQVAQTAGRRDRPPPLREQCRPFQQLPALLFRGPDRQLGDFGFVAVDSHRGVRPLVRIDAESDLATRSKA